MPLLDRSRMPPGGFYYAEPSISWHTPNPYLPFSMIVGQIQRARLNNPAATLNPSYDACAAALDTATCDRLRNDSRWCAPSGSLAAVIAAEPAKRRVGGCSSCGSRRSRAKAAAK